jgi:TetR/AcrR family transcriptional regulator, repressor for uid operon
MPKILPQQLFWRRLCWNRSGIPENDSVRISREFLTWAVDDAIKSGEIAPETDVSTMAETLLVVLCGVGFYAGFVGSYEEIEAITTSLGQLIGGKLWRPSV